MVKNMRKLNKVKYYNKEFILPELIYIDTNKFFDDGLTYEILRKITIKWKECKDILDILKKYAKNDGWSDGWTIEFWNMKPRELNKVVKFFTREDKGE